MRVSLIVVSHKKSLFGWLVRLVTRQPWDHVALMFLDDKRRMVVEFGPRGFSLVTLENYRKGRKLKTVETVNVPVGWFERIQNLYQEPGYTWWPTIRNWIWGKLWPESEPIPAKNCVTHVVDTLNLPLEFVMFSPGDFAELRSYPGGRFDSVLSQKS